MEQSKFNLQQSINDYISSINGEGSLTGSDVAELTNHLSDATEALQKQNLSEEEAFLIACKRLGKSEVLAQEYSKVNPSIQTNKVWAYLLIGYNLFYNFPAVVFLGVGYFYIQVYQNLGRSTAGIWIVVAFHLLFVAGIYYLVRQKNRISAFIEKQVNLNPVRIVCLSFIPFVSFFIAKPTFGIPVWELNAALIDYPVRTFQSDLTEFSFYLAVLSILAGVLSLIFSIRFQGKITLQRLFEKPSIWLLILFGVFIEFAAASTRALRIPFDTELVRSSEGIMRVDGTYNKIASAACFGLMYLIASFLITYYNKFNSTNRYLLIFSSFGFIMETAFGISADINRGNTVYTVYYVSALLIGVFLGKMFGLKASGTLHSDAKLYY